MHRDENYFVAKYVQWTLWIISFSLAVYSIAKNKLDVIRFMVVLCNVINYLHLFDVEGYRFDNKPMQNIR